MDSTELKHLGGLMVAMSILIFCGGLLALTIYKIVEVDFNLIEALAGGTLFIIPVVMIAYLRIWLFLAYFYFIICCLRLILLLCLVALGGFQWQSLFLFLSVANFLICFVPFLLLAGGLVIWNREEICNK